MATRSHKRDRAEYEVTLKGTPSHTTPDVAWELHKVTRKTPIGEAIVEIPSAENVIRGSEDAAFARVFDDIDRLPTS